MSRYSQLLEQDINSPSAGLISLLGRVYLCPLSLQAQTPMPGNGPHLCSCNRSLPFITELQNGYLILHSRKNTMVSSTWSSVSRPGRTSCDNGLDFPGLCSAVAWSEENLVQVINHQGFNQDPCPNTSPAGEILSSFVSPWKMSQYFIWVTIPKSF